MTTEHRELRWKGLGVSDGVVIGRVLRIHDGTGYVYRTNITDAQLEPELRRFRVAVGLARRQLRAIKKRAEKKLGKDHAYIFDAHLLLLEDEKLISDIDDFITQEHTNAEWALKVIGDRLLSIYSEIKDDYLRGRGSDIEDVVQRLLVALSGKRPRHRKLSQAAVIVSQDLLPSTLAELDLEHTRAVATETGGWTSHTAIIARGLGIPAVVGLHDFYRKTRTGDEIVVDSSRGEVILHPSRKTVAEHQAQTTHLVVNLPGEIPKKRGPVLTHDKVAITLRANVEVPAEFDGVRSYGASGVGLYRSEFLLAQRGLLFSEAEQYNAYREIARIAGQEGAIVRLFDLGSENVIEPIQEAERNPALGLRAIRFGLRHESVIRTQLRAILRAAAEGRLGIVLPMVADVGDVLRTKEILKQEETNLEREGSPIGKVRIGAMIEVPSAVLTVEKIASRVDFFELGTNDLVQYTLAVDRGNDKVADWFRTLHPAVLHSIKRTLIAARAAGIPAIICGEMASTPAYAVLLVGLGALELSMTPASIPRVRHALSSISFRDASAIAEECLGCETADEVEDLVRQRFGANWPQLFPSSSLPQARPK